MSDTFSFSYLVVTVTATLDGTSLAVKQGLRTQKAPLDAVQFLYVKAHQDRFRELIVAYEVGPQKLKHLRVFSNTGEAGFTRLVEALVALKPAADLRAVPEDEAFKRMKAVNTEKAALVAVPLIVVAAMAGFVAPMLLHGLDKGRAEITAAALAGGERPASRNLVLRGGLDFAHVIQEDTTSNGSTSSRYLFPVVDEQWAADHPIAVVLETGLLTPREAQELAREGRYRCTLRDALWEGLTSERAGYFKREYGVEVSANVKLCEHAPNGSDDLVLAGVSLGATTVIMIVVMAIVVARRRRT